MLSCLCLFLCPDLQIEVSLEDGDVLGVVALDALQLGGHVRGHAVQGGHRHGEGWAGGGAGSTEKRGPEKPKIRERKSESFSAVDYFWERFRGGEVREGTPVSQLCLIGLKKAFGEVERIK